MSYTMEIILKEYNYLIKMIENHDFESTYTFAGIARQTNIGSFNANMEVLKALSFYRVLIVKDHKYMIDRRRLLDYIF